MKKNIARIIIIFLVSFTLLSTVCLANPIDTLNSQIQWDDPASLNTMNDLRGKIYTIFQIVGTGIAVISGLILGIKFIMSSPNDRAEIKKYLIIYVTAAVIFFGAIGIVGILSTFGKEIF